MSEVIMYKNILLPVDGSEFAMGSVPYALRFAKAVGARITAIHVTAPYETVAVGELASFLVADEYVKRAEANAAAVLDRVKRAAQEAGVPVKTYQVEHAHPWEAIIQTASDEACDLILMASHGRRGIVGVLLGSETKKVLTHTAIPVLVWRGA
jgi:nucleotide-binding universal stress UspA family protein